ncbi:malate synthase A [Mesoterricola silvestris]|uniref:malate synthase n=1 Tax=Mesoterricola silvestris TaxID=2927979 RepID=A0AA48GZL0_9BACT|nr:malate synthase A [Mesoterricola silvestris]BDU73288.1 malate synthase A [Mesoterricola silvestris]
MTTKLLSGIARSGYPYHADPGILSEGALAFLKDLTRSFRPALEALLVERTERQARHDAGEAPGFLPSTREIRHSQWQVAPLPPLLLDRRVEITGPPERKMLINALNSGARVYMADFEDSLAPSLENLVEGQRNLVEAVRGTLRHVDPPTGRVYALEAHVAALMVRPRGLHLPERHLEVDGQPIPACLFDAGLFLYHNAAEILARGGVPCLYLPKLEHHLEARWWNQVLEAVEANLGLAPDSVRTTLLIETLPAAFQMDEILFEHRGRAAGLNLGRWDYIFSFIKTRRMDPGAILPDRGRVDMDQPFLRAYARLLVRTCHRRGCLALGGMSAFVPARGDAEGTARAFAQVRADKLREVADGCDGTWVAHPALVPVAQAPFDEHMAGPNQLDRVPDPVDAEELLAVPRGPRTEKALRHNLKVGIRYLESWLRGQGCVALYGLMEDAATAEICRMQVWQWIRHGAEVEHLGQLDRPLFHAFVEDALFQIRAEIGEADFAEGRFLEASDLFETLILARVPPPFLTLPAYDLLLEPVPSEVNP